MKPLIRTRPRGGHRRFPLLALVFALVVSPGLRAVIYSYCATPQTFASDGSGGTSWLPFDRFDPRLGQLIAVGVQLSADVLYNQVVWNAGTAPGSISIRQTANFFVGRCDGSPFIRAAETVDAAHPDLPPSGIGGAQTFTFHRSLFEDELTTRHSDLTAFVGPGTIHLPFRATGVTQVAGGAHLGAETSIEATGQVLVCYAYIPVPEPSTWALVGLGLVGFWAARRPCRSGAKTGRLPRNVGS